MSCSIALNTVTRSVLALLRDNGGATAIEYAFIASLISISILVGARVIGTNLDTTFSNVAANLT